MTEVARRPQYDVFAEDYLAHAAISLYNAHYDRPACLALLGDVCGRRVLDAACGPGLYAADLARRGARVTGFDASPRMIELCRVRVPAGRFLVHDLADPIGWLDTASVDLALCALAIEYVDDRVAALRELRRVLRPDGALVLSRQHPTADWLHNGGSYFDQRVVEETWSRGWQVRYWVAPLQVTCQEFYAAGFLIERLIEPRPVSGARPIDPDNYDRLLTEPGFYRLPACAPRLRLTRTGGAGDTAGPRAARPRPPSPIELRFGKNNGYLTCLSQPRRFALPPICGNGARRHCSSRMPLSPGHHLHSANVSCIRTCRCNNCYLPVTYGSAHHARSRR